MLETQTNLNDVTSHRSESLDALADDLLAVCSPHEAGVLGLLAVGHLHDFNPWESIDRLGFELSVRQRLKYRWFAESLAEHDELIPAIDDNLKLLPNSVNIGLKLANQTGQLTALMQAISLRRQRQSNDAASISSSTWFRALRTLLQLHVLLGVLTFIALFIVPQFQVMMAEFGMEWPPAFELFLHVLEVFCGWVVPVLAFLLVVALVFALPLFRRLVRRLTPSRWRQRFSDRVAKKQRMVAAAAQLCGSLKKGVQGLEAVLPAGNQRPQFEKAAAGMASGQDLRKALVKNKLVGSRQADAVMATESLQTQAWLLRSMADRRDQRNETRRGGVLQILIAIAYTVLGLMVAITALGVFGVLLSIINGLS